MFGAGSGNVGVASVPPAAAPSAAAAFHGKGRKLGSSNANHSGVGDNDDMQMAINASLRSLAEERQQGLRRNERGRVVVVVAMKVLQNRMKQAPRRVEAVLELVEVLSILLERRRRRRTKRKAKIAVMLLLFMINTGDRYIRIFRFIER